MSGPRVTSGKDSVQEVGTPPDFLAALTARFGAMDFDLAANASNRIVLRYFGPDSLLGTDSLAQDWTKLTGNLWLNPPFQKFKNWARKCFESMHEGSKIFLLGPAAVGSNWFKSYVDMKALVIFTSPRMKFVGHKTPFPKDLMLAVYGEKPGYECWRWKTAKEKRK